MHAFGWTWNNFRNMITKTPITSLDDCKGYKLRSPKHRPLPEHLQHPRHEPHRRSLNEAYTAMQSGLVDGVESGLEAFYTQGFYELGKYVCLSRHMISVIGPVMNADKWNSLDEATQELFTSTWKQCQEELNETVIANESGYQTKLEEAGCTITQFDDQQALIDLFTRSGARVPRPAATPICSIRFLPSSTADPTELYNGHPNGCPLYPKQCVLYLTQKHIAQDIR